MKKLCTVFLNLILCLGLLTGTASADIGPKPSINVTFTHAGGEPYYATLLSQSDTTGPASAWDGSEEDIRCGDVPREIWQAFVEYEDTDGYYFLQESWDCADTNALNWTYYPPANFKILCYFPATDTYLVSPIYERYAFDAYYTVDLSRPTDGMIYAVSSYDYTWETVSLLVRILLTIALELLIALAFGYRDKTQLRFITICNTVTQILLNLLLNIINYVGGSMAFVLAYILLELLVFGIEAGLYAAFLPRWDKKERKRRVAVLYALTANGLSFAAGLWIAHWIPGIF